MSLLANFKDTILLRVLCNFLQAEWCQLASKSSRNRLIFYLSLRDFFLIVVIEFDVFYKIMN